MTAALDRKTSIAEQNLPHQNNFYHLLTKNATSTKLLPVKITQQKNVRVEVNFKKICKRSGEKWIFSPQDLHTIRLSNAVNLCNLIARTSGEVTKIHHISWLKYVFSPLITSYRSYTVLKLSPPACQRHIVPLRHLSIIARLIVSTLNQINSDFCKMFTVKLHISAENKKCGDIL